MKSFLNRLCRWMVLAAVCCVAPTWAQTPAAVDIPPNIFVQTVMDQALQTIVQNEAIRAGDSEAIASVVNSHVLPHLALEKTTRLAAGRHWRNADATQRQALVAAFTGTLMRTYSSALRLVTAETRLSIQPYRGDSQATDAVVRATLHHEGSAPIALDYRLEKTAQGWKIYDVNVEGIWLIQNYRNQFSQEITAHGIDGLIATLNRRNS